MEKKYPFKFLKSYDQNDVDIFFGRDEEIDALYEMAFQNSILLVYGASGTGKTSLIQCGLASRFKSYDWLALMIRRGTNINESLEKILMENGGNNLPEKANPAKNLSGLQRLIKSVYLSSFKPVYLIFDQFEELYVLGTKDEQEKFIEAVKEILSAEQPVKMIFSIREEYLGYLYEFEKEVPHLLRKKLRVEPMTIDKVKNVMEGINNYEFSNVKIKDDEIDAITKGVFERLKGKKKTLTIQLPYLQVFLDKLYIESTGDETRQADALITMEILDHIGDIGDVLRNFLEEQVKTISQKLSLNNKNVDAETIWKILSPFSTLDGTKEPISKKELAERLPNLDPKLIDEAVESFVNSRILYYNEGSNLYELAHDSLALRIAQKRTDEDIALLEVRRLIKNQASLKGEVKDLFSKKVLNFIEPFLQKITLSEDEKRLIDQSKEFYLKAEQRNKAKRKRIFLSIAGTTVLVIAILAWFLIQARIAKNDNIELLANNYWNNSKSKKAENDYTYALAQAYKAFSLSKDKNFKENVLMEIEDNWPSVILKNIITDKSQIISAAFIEDGKKIISISKDFHIRWTNLSGDSLTEKKFLTKDKVSNIIHITPDGKNILTLDSQGYLNIWDINSEKRLDTDSIRIKPTFYFMPIFNRGGSRFLVYQEGIGMNCYLTNGFRKLNFSTKELIKDADFFPDGKMVLTVDYNNNSISIINLETRNRPLRLDLHIDLSFDQDKYDQYLKLGRINKNSTFQDFYDTLKYTSQIKSVRLSPDGSMILTANGDSTIRLWDLSGKQIGDPMKLQNPVDFAMFSPDATKILSIDAENSTQVWDVVTRKKMGHAFKLESFGVFPEFSPDSKNILTIINGTVLIWQLQQENIQDDNEEKKEITRNVVYSPNLKKIVEIRNNGGFFNYKIFETDSGKIKGLEIRSKCPYTMDYNAISTWFSPDGKRLLTRYTEDSIQLWNADLATRIGPGIPYTSSGELIFSPDETEISLNKRKPDNRKLIIKYDNDTVFKLQLWSAETGKRIGKEIVHQKIQPGIIQNSSDPGYNSQDVRISGMTAYDQLDPKEKFPEPTFSSDGNSILIFFNSADSLFFEILDAESGVIKGPKHAVSRNGYSDFDFWDPFISPDGKYILAPVNDSTAYLLDAGTGKQKGGIVKHHAYWHPVYSPDGKWILTCSSDSTVQFVEAESGNKKGQPIKHLSEDFYPNWPIINKDGSRVLTVVGQGIYNLWNTETQKQIKEEFKHESFSMITPPVFSPDGKMFLTADNSGTARIYFSETGNQKGAPLNHPKSDLQEIVFSRDSKKILILTSKYAGAEKEGLAATIWDAVSGKQTGHEIKDIILHNGNYMNNENKTENIKFSDDGKWLLYSNTYSGEQLLNTEAGDLDIPADLLELQVQVASGNKYDFSIDENIPLNAKEFLGKDGILKKYNDLAKKHYKEQCRFTKYNFWKRFNLEDAKILRPDDFQEKSKAESIASQFQILPEFQLKDTVNKENNGRFLEPNQAIYSKNKKYLLAYQVDGDLVIYRIDGKVPIWATGTSGYPAYRTIMQFDGNLVIYSGNPKGKGDQAIWSSNTWVNNANAYLRLEDNGNLVIYNTKNEIVWQSYSIDDFETLKSR